MIGLSDIFWGGVVPALVAAATLAIVWRGTGKAASAWRTALVVGYVAGHWALDTHTISFAAALTKSFHPTEARDWLPLLMLLAIVPDALACVGKVGPLLGWLLRGALCAFVPWRLLHGSVYLPLSMADLGFEGVGIDLGGWSSGERAAWIGSVGAALLIGWQGSRSVDQQSCQSRDACLRSALAVAVAFGGAIVMAMSDSLVYGQLFGVLTAALAGCGLSSALLSTGRGPEAAAGPAWIAFGSLLVVGHFYAGLKIHNAALLLVTLILAIGWLPLPAKLSPRWQAVGRSLLCLIVLGIAVTLAGLDFAATSTSPAKKVAPTGYSRSTSATAIFIRSAFR